MSDWTPDALCPTCGKGPFKNALAWTGHKQSKGHPGYVPYTRTPVPAADNDLTAPIYEGATEDAPEEASVPFKPPPPTVPVIGGQAVIPSWKRASRMRGGIRSITMCDPRCRPCQSADNAPLDWYKTCPHDPYVTIVPVKYDKPITEPEMVNGQPTGREIIVRVEKLVSYYAIPNTRQIGLSMGANSGKGVEWARRKGFITPSEVRSPHFPNGVAETCQYHDCYWQQGLVRYKVGTFCREEEARLVWYRETGKTLEVGEWSNDARQHRIDALALADI